MSAEPKNGARVVPSEFKAWVNVKRAEAVSGLPRMATNGLAATWSRVIPEARMNKASRKMA